MREGYILRGQIRKTFKNSSTRHLTFFAVFLALFMVASPIAYATNYQTKINDLKKKNAANQSEKQDLAASAANISDRIAQLQSEIGSLETQIRKNQAKDRALKQEIAKAEQEISRQRALLGKSVKQMYLEDEMSTIEMIASSRSLGEYADREQHRTSVQNEIGKIVQKIDELKKKLDGQKKQVERLLADQKSMQNRLAKQRAESSRLLAMNQQEQSQLNRSMRANSAKITELQRLQAIENARHNIGSISYSGTGGYPWPYVSYPSYSVDPWGMYKRECVSYTAWKVSSTGRHMPYWGGRGNAKNWDDNARAAGIPTDYSPRPGDVAISNSGTYGHAMYVERVHGDGTITVSQYNAGWDGRYSVVKRSTSGLVFIHF